MRTDTPGEFNGDGRAHGRPVAGNGRLTAAGVGDGWATGRGDGWGNGYADRGSFDGEGYGDGPGYGKGTGGFGAGLELGLEKTCTYYD